MATRKENLINEALSSTVVHKRKGDTNQIRILLSKLTLRMKLLFSFMLSLIGTAYVLYNNPESSSTSKIIIFLLLWVTFSILAIFHHYRAMVLAKGVNSTRDLAMSHL